MSSDQVADMLTIIRNGQMAGKSDVILPFSKMKLAIAQILKKKGCVEGASIYSEGNKNFLKINLKYENGKPYIRGIRKISHQGQRIYVGKGAIPMAKSGFGFVVISTSQGVLTGEEASARGLGGELICEIW